MDHSIIVIGRVMKENVFIKKIITFLVLSTLIFSPYKVFAATVTTFSDSLSDSRPSTVSNHTIVWDVVDATGIQADDVFTLTFAANFDTASIVEDDVDIADDGSDKTTAADCSGTEEFGVAMAGDVLTITACTELTTIEAASVVTIEIGTNATANGTGSHQITNPTAGSYTIALADTTGYTDTGEIQVAVIAGVTTSLNVSASLSVTVSAVNSADTVNSATTSVTSTASTMPFGTMTVNSDKVGAHSISVSTNAAEGYTVGIRWLGTGTNDGLASGSNNCDGFTNDTATNADPKAWAAGTNPSGVAANTNTCWYGYTTEDTALGTGTADRFTSSGGDKWAPFSSTPYEVIYSSGPVNAEATKVGHKVEANAMQPQGSYTGTVEYIATAVF